MAHGHRSPNAEANAALIVRAVNSHDALVAALQECESQLTALANKCRLVIMPAESFDELPVFESFDVGRKARAAIAQATGYA